LLHRQPLCATDDGRGLAYQKNAETGWQRESDIALHEHQQRVVSRKAARISTPEI
jgi:hypothetical protein